MKAEPLLVLFTAESSEHRTVPGKQQALDKYLSKDELLQLIYTQPSQKDVIPYVTSYYKERSGFCMSQIQKDQIQNSEDQKYHAFIDST